MNVLVHNFSPFDIEDTKSPQNPPKTHALDGMDEISKLPGTSSGNHVHYINYRRPRWEGSLTRLAAVAALSRALENLVHNYELQLVFKYEPGRNGKDNYGIRAATAAQ